MINPNTAFEFSTAGKILFGSGKIRLLGELAKPMGKKGLVVCGKDKDRMSPIIEQLRSNELETVIFQVQGEPKVNDIEQGVELAHDSRCDMIIALGGGSVIDAGKAIGALLTNPGSPIDYLEIIGQGKPLLKQPAPCIAIPTTAGTGAEVTANSVLASPGHRVKVSLRHARMLPDIALIDPELTLSLPPHISALTGLDAFTQVIEPYVSIHASPMTDLLCQQGIKLAGRSLVKVFTNGADLLAREEMALTSLYGGLALANAKLGAVHGIAGPFGGMYEAPHGGVCAALLPHVMKANIKALTTRAPGHFALDRYRHIAAILTGDDGAGPLDAARAVLALTARFSISGLRTYGFQHQEIDLLAEKALKASSMRGNPIELTKKELCTIIEAAA